MASTNDVLPENSHCQTTEVRGALVR